MAIQRQFSRGEAFSKGQSSGQTIIGVPGFFWKMDGDNARLNNNGGVESARVRWTRRLFGGLNLVRTRTVV